MLTQTYEEPFEEEVELRVPNVLQGSKPVDCIFSESRSISLLQIRAGLANELIVLVEHFIRPTGASFKALLIVPVVCLTVALLKQGAESPVPYTKEDVQESLARLSRKNACC